MSEEYAREWSRLHGGYAVDRSRLVHGWLRFVSWPATRLARRGVHPNAVTLAGIGSAVLAAVVGWPWAAAILVAASAWCDGVDGAVAVLARRVSAMGQVLDAVGDRIADVAFVIALWRLTDHDAVAGALAAAAGATVLLFEYLRARSVSAGLDDIGTVTVGERPGRGAAVVGPVVVRAGGAAPE